ncbi:MAG: pyridoxamine 5'-phosphate oxidase family protein [Anaerobutyricum soehngenii]
MRRRDREVTEHSEIMHILDSGKVLHLGLVDQGKPYIVPMNYGYVFEGEKLVFYLHGALEGRKLDIIRNNSDCCVQLSVMYSHFQVK